MKKMIDLIVAELTPAFTECGYDEKYVKVTVSNRPDLCEYQCNGGSSQGLQKEAYRHRKRGGGEGKGKPDVL